MGEHVLLFCLLGLVFAATIVLVTAPRAVTWAPGPYRMSCGNPSISAKRISRLLARLLPSIGTQFLQLGPGI
jgi:hypothetical protein